MPKPEVERSASHSPTRDGTDDKTDNTEKQAKDDRPTGLRFILIFVAICLGVFLCALDATIIATAIPAITSDFHSLDDFSWYNAAYLLCTCAFQLPFGRAYKIMSTKWTLVGAIAIFEVGSAVCGASPTSLALIIGRAIQGTGAAGIFGGAFIVIAENVPLEKRSLYAGLLAAMFAIASVAGPLLGGVFTDSAALTWRWCFYINLPLGGVALAAVLFFLRPSKEVSEVRKESTWLRIFLKFDPLGTALLVPSIVSLLLALQWGGTIYPWSDYRVIVSLVCFAVSILLWIADQIWQGEEATVPLSVIKQRTVAGAALYTLTGAAAFTVVVYYLPTWFQAIKQDSAFESGIHTLALTLSVVTGAITGGAGVSVVGYYMPFLIFGTIMMSVGSGLLMTLSTESGTATWIGYQIIFGLGIGASLEQCNIAAQTVVTPPQIPAATSLMVFARALGGSLSIAIAENVFQKSLRAELQRALPDFNPAIVSNSGATDLLTKIKMETGGNSRLVHEILLLYNHAVTRTFEVALILACLTALTILAIEWKSVKKQKQGKEAEEDVEKTIEKDKTEV